MTDIAYFLLISLTIMRTNTYVTGGSQIFEIASRPVRVQQFLSYADNYIKPRVNTNGEVTIQLYYESFCLGCRDFHTTRFQEVVLKLNKYVNIQTYPYGNAKTFVHNGKYTFKCQHGPKECYGNKLHACALNIIQNSTEALLFTSCMMDSSQNDNGSDDLADDVCGKKMSIDSEAIKACAKSEKGKELLKYYGDESIKVNYQYVPYILINGNENDGDNFMRDVCAAFATPPPPCVPNVLQNL